MRIDSTGNVGIGTSDPSVRLDVRSGTSINTVTDANVKISNDGGNTVALALSQTGRGTLYLESISAASIPADAQIRLDVAGALRFASGGSERMRIDTSGNLLVGMTSGSRKVNITYTAASGGIYMETTNNDSTFLSVIRSATVHVQHKIIGSTYQIVNDSNGVSLAVGGTSWGVVSDERKKDIIEPIENAAEKVSSLRAVIGKYKTDNDDKRRAFLIAQDVQKVLPEAVEEDKDGDLLLMYTDTIPLLVAAVKELKAELDSAKEANAALEARITAIENGA